MKDLHSQYFPLPYVIISYIDEQRDTSTGQHSLLPNLSKQTEWICFAKSTKELKIPIDILIYFLFVHLQALVYHRYI